MTFDEFLHAFDPALALFYDTIEKGSQIEEIFHNRLLEAYDNYLIIRRDAGMCCFLDRA